MQHSLLPPLLVNHVVPFIGNDTWKRLRINHLKPGQRFIYLLKEEGFEYVIWCGHGQTPKWVQNYLAEGGTLDDLRAFIPEAYLK